MRGKSNKHRHKESNTFKFQSFSERISNLKIDVFHRIKHVNEEESETETYLYQALDKWSLLNSSASYTELQKEIKNVQTLPQILKQKDHIISVLIKHLEAKNALDLQPVLELVVALAKDLRQDFYCDYNKIHKCLISLLEIHDPDILEWTFHCLAYLFKFLWRYLVTDLQNIFESLMPLLSSSRPFYINNFAAESFAFVARKVKDQKKFLLLTLKLLKKFPDGIDGCGKLLFEVVKGVSGRFHSCAESTLSVYLEFLKESGVTFNVFCQVITVAYCHMIKYIHPSYCDLLWTTLQSALVKIMSESKSDHKAEGINFILNIIKVGVENRSGGLIKDSELLANSLIEIIHSTSEHQTSSIDSASEILSLLLLLPKVNLTQELASKIVVSAMSCLKDDSLLLFMERVLYYSGFDGLVLPRLLKYCCNHPVDATLPLLSKLILFRSPPPVSAYQLMDCPPFHLNFPSVVCQASKAYDELVLDELSKQCAGTMVSNMDKMSSYLLILPAINNVNRSRALQVLTRLMKNLCSFLSENCTSCCNCTVDTNDCYLIQKATMIMLLVIQSCIKLRSDCPSKLCPPDLFLPAILKFCQSEEHLSAIRALDFYVTSDELNIVADYTEEIKEKIWINLMSPYHKVRLLSVHILYELEKGFENSNALTLQILESSWLAELTPATLSEYREKLKHIQRLEVDCTLAMSSDCIKSSAALLLGQLFVNFKLIWSPTGKVLASIARIAPSDTIWPIIHSQLTRISFLIRERCPSFKLEYIYSTDYLCEMYSKLNNYDDRPDFINYRILLWNTMKEFSDLCELKNRDVVAEFLTFIENEYFAQNSELANTWNIKHISNEDDIVTAGAVNDSIMETNNISSMSESQLMDVDVTVDEHSESVDNLDKEESFENNKSDEEEGIETEDDKGNADDGVYEMEPEPESAIYKWANKSLQVHLELLSKFKAPRSVSRENELHRFYLEFLSHRLPDIQKAALDCLLTYKDMFLIPYRKYLYNLIDDKTFKQEINIFRIDAQSDVVKSDHRVDLIPIVLRIVYIKMFTGSVKGKNSKYVRRAAVIRFLGGCTSKELNSYFNMAFPLFIKHIQDDAVNMVKEIMFNVDVERAVPPRRLQSLISQLRTLVIHTGGLLDPSVLSRLLRLVLCHAASIVGALIQRQLVHSTYVKTLRSIRSTAFDIMIWFFDKFQSHPWSTNEIDAIFSVFVWPLIEKFHLDSVNAPTPLLKLFSVWSQNPRYFILLGQWSELNGKKYSPLSSIMELWLSKTHKSIYNIITDVVERLLTLIPSEDLDSTLEIKISHSPFSYSLPFPEKAFSSLNFGSKLMLQNAGSVMEKLRQKLSEGSNISGKELEIMSRITELVMQMEESNEMSERRDTSQSEALFSLLLPILMKRASSSEHITTVLLQSINNLAMLIPSPGKHIRTLAPLFAKINGPVPRKLLTSLIISSHKRGGSDCDLNYDIIEDMNAFNVKWLDQPDFDRRLDSFKKIDSLMKDNSITYDMGLIIIHTCFYFICTEKDLSLKDSSSQCLRTICPHLAKHYNESHASLRHLLVDQTILNIIKDGIRNKQEEFVRNESIVLLGIMVRECPETHSVLNDLSLLTNKDDLEMDFFENMQHLQHHRRLRAMVRFCETMKEYKKIPKPRSMTQFILPIVSYYLCNEKYSSRPTVIDCAAQALATICRILPWHQYLEILKYYLEKLQKKNEYQKQLVRINIDILNAFHFDLSSAEKEDIDIIQSDKSLDMTIEDDGVEREKTSSDIIEDELVLSEKEDLDNGDDEGKDIPMEEGDDIATVEPSPNINIMEHISVLPRSSSARMIKVIKEQLIKKLQRALGHRSPQDSCHRSTKKQSLEDSDQQDMIRIPLAIAIVKLLQKLPSQFLETNLSGVLMKVVSYLKSRMEGVRRVARKTLQEIAVSLGPVQLCHLVKEMTPLLTRGFHVHVLSYTVHSILISLKPYFKQGDIDPAIPHILEVCRMDLFGGCSEEKEVAQILGKVLEARSSKSFSSFNIMAQFISEKYLLDLVIPLKNELSQTLAAKSVKKVWECLRQLVLGLSENQFLSEESLVLFAYGSASESIPSLLPVEDPQQDPKMKEWQARRGKDCFLIASEPKRQKCPEMKACSRTNSHLLVEFGLRLLYVLLRRERLKDPKYLPHLDPLVKLLAECLKSQHVKVSTMAIQCLCWILKYELPSLKEYMNDLIDSLFAILHKYAASGLSKGDNFELVFVTFKAMGVLVREVKFTRLSDDQMRVLLMYCEQDLEDHSRQATAFSLLKAVIVGKVNSPELPDIMKKVASISITAPLDSVRVQARQVVHHYLMEYALGKKLNDFLSFYYGNLDYDLQQGRESVLDMLQTVVDTFPQGKLEEEASVMFINLAARLVNDPSPECRKKVSSIMTNILMKVNKNTKDRLFDVAETWLEQNKDSTRRLAAQVIGLFVSIEKEEFSSRLNRILPLLVDQFIMNNNKPGKFVLLSRANETKSAGDEEENEMNEKFRDHLLFQVLQVLSKIITHIPDTLIDEQLNNHWSAIIGHTHSLLCHEHEWVRLGAVQLLGLCLSSVPPSDLAYNLSHPPEYNDESKPEVKCLFSLDPRSTLRSITLDLLAQLTPDNQLNDKFILQIMKLLVYIAEVLKELKPRQHSKLIDLNDKEETLSLPWLVRKIRRIINGEIVHAPTSTSVRTMCFNWMAAVAVKLDRTSVTSIGYHLVAPLARELSLGEETDPLRKVARDASQYIKSKLGHDEYNRLLTLATSKMDIKKAQRKTERAQMAISDPVRAAKRKILKQQKKKSLKKRKINISKTNNFKKKNKEINLEDN